MSTTFRCASSSVCRNEPCHGTASTVAAFLLIEHPGPWGADALADARLPAAVRDWLIREPKRHRVRALLIRRHGRSAPQRRRIFAVYAGAKPWVESGLVADYDEVRGVDLAALRRGQTTGMAAWDTPLFCVCTHGRHDTCCAERGRPVAASLCRSHPEETWEVSHIGGDRFAANMLVLPDGVYYGRVEPDTVASVADRHLDGQVDLDHLRGHCRYGFAVQSAEYFLRRELDEQRLDAVRLIASNSTDEVTEATFGVDASEWAVRVRSVRAGPEQLTCNAAGPSQYPQHVLAGIRRRT